MKLKIELIDAFADKAFEGNPAAVCELQQWLPDTTLQAIASENNLSETAFYIQKGVISYDLRWFTPTVEVDLCGHATLATAFSIFDRREDNADVLQFDTRSGQLTVSKSVHGLSMDFPLTKPLPVSTPVGLLEALGLAEGEVFEADDYVVVVSDESLIENLSPDFSALSLFPKRGVAVTAPGQNYDFVSRWFGPRVGVNEDPVTGSAHTWLAPYWAERLGKPVLRAKQGSARTGTIICEVAGNRVVLSGNAVRYLRGEIEF